MGLSPDPHALHAGQLRQTIPTMQLECVRGSQYLHISLNIYGFIMRISQKGPSCWRPLEASTDVYRIQEPSLIRTIS